MTRREFLVRSATLAGRRVPEHRRRPACCAAAKRQAAMAATPAYHAVDLVHHHPRRHDHHAHRQGRDGPAHRHRLRADHRRRAGSAVGQGAARHAARERGELRDLRPGLHGEQRQRDHRVRPHLARRCAGPHRADRGRRQAAGRQARRLLRRQRPRHRQGLRPLDRLRRDPAEGEDRPQVRLSGRLQEGQAQGPQPVQDHRQVGAGAGHPGQDQRPGQVRHGRVPAGHGLRRAGDSAHPLRLQGAVHRRQRSEEDPRLHQGGEDRRLDGQVHRLGGGAGGDVPGRDEGEPRR